MFPNHGLDVEQTEPVALHVMQITGGNAVELIEYVALLFGSDTYSTVADGDFDKFSLFRYVDLPAADVYFRFFWRVFYGVIYQVADDVTEMSAVGGKSQVFRLDIYRYMHGLLRFQCVLFDERLSLIHISEPTRRS